MSTARNGVPLSVVRGARRGAAAGLFLLSSAAFAADDFRCLKSVGQADPIRLQFSWKANDDQRGYVAYQNGKGRIDVTFLKETELRRNGGRSSEVETQWQEVTADGSGGTYAIVSQGARISQFRYLRKKDGKVFTFEEDLAATGDDRCKWQGKPAR